MYGTKAMRSSKKALLVLTTILCILVTVQHWKQPALTILEESPRKYQDIASNNLKHGKYLLRENIDGVLLDEKGEMDYNEFTLTISLVHSFFPNTENAIRKMFADNFIKNKYYLTGPAITRNGHNVLVVQRIWLSHFEKQRFFPNVYQPAYNTFSENYIYMQVLNNKDYEPLSKISLVGIPTSTNADNNFLRGYRTDGPMDPRLITINDTTFISFHMWSGNKRKDGRLAMAGRMHIWDCNKNTIRKLYIRNYEFQLTEINWVPFEYKKTLHFVYSMDPFKILQCNTTTGECVFKSSARYNSISFKATVDHLRGGTPFVKYRHPYYISISHSTVYTSNWFSLYNSHIVIMAVKPTFRIVYVSRAIPVHDGILKSCPLVRDFTILNPFIYPLGIILQNDNVMDISLHVNDCQGFILRMTGIKRLINAIIRKKNHDTGPPARFIQDLIGTWTKQEYPNITFQSIP